MNYLLRIECKNCRERNHNICSGKNSKLSEKQVKIECILQ